MIKRKKKYLSYLSAKIEKEKVSFIFKCKDAKDGNEIFEIKHD